MTGPVIGVAVLPSRSKTSSTPAALDPMFLTPLR
jgi:hypothetical protein